jgi:hypothetical protein
MKKAKGLLQVLGSEEREKIRVLIKMIQLVVKYLIDINLMVVLPNKLTERDITLSLDLQITYNAEYEPKAIYL